MEDKKVNIAIIPARGGSKRIPRKNIKNFCGKPMIAWSIEAAQKTNLFDKIIVSTDDDEIKTIAEYYGAIVPFKRPNKLSDDYTPTIDVVVHAIEWLQNKNWKILNVCCLYATAPFINYKDVMLSYIKLNEKECNYVFPITEFEYTIFRSFSLLENEGIKMVFPKNFYSRSQDLPNAFHDAGQFYWGKLNAWLSYAKFFDTKSYPIIIPKWRVQDIDPLGDWERASKLFDLLAN